MITATLYGATNPLTEEVKHVWEICGLYYDAHLFKIGTVCGLMQAPDKVNMEPIRVAAVARSNHPELPLWRFVHIDRRYC